MSTNRNLIEANEAREEERRLSKVGAWLRDSEKEAINAARKLRIAEIDRLQLEVNALDDRYDVLEEAEEKQ